MLIIKGICLLFSHLPTSHCNRALQSGREHQHWCRIIREFSAGDSREGLKPVSYTHLDVYKRQEDASLLGAVVGIPPLQYWVSNQPL